MRFSRKFLDEQHGSGGEAVGRTGNPACAKNSGGLSRRATRGERGKLPLRVRREGGASMRLHVGSIKDPAPARVRKTHFPFFRMQSLQSFGGLVPPGREIPHAPQTRPPRLPKYRGRRGPAGDRRSNGRQEGDRLRRMRSSAASGCPCACGARVTHAICKRYRSHIPTQPI